MQILSFLSLGTNLGNRRQNLKKAYKLLKQNKRVKVIKSSPVYETEPVGRIKQKDFLNAIVKIKTDLGPLELLRFCKDIESRMKRKKTVKWGPRVIDIDIVVYGNKKVRSKQLIIPHKEAAKREFVLKPLTDIYRNGRHAVSGKTFKSLLKTVTEEKKINNRSLKADGRLIQKNSYIVHAKSIPDLKGADYFGITK